MLIVDIDKLFQKYVAANIGAIKGTVSDDNLDEKKEELYSSFQSHPFEELGGKTPLEFYEDKDLDLIEVLCEHFNKNVPVSEYLIHALIDKEGEDELIKLLDANKPSDLLLIVIEVLTHKNSKKCVNGLIDLLFDEKTADEVKDACAQALEEEEGVFCKLIDKIDSGNVYIGGAACELLSRQTIRDKRITEILTNKLLENLDKAPEYCSYIVEYGDEASLEGLYEAIQKVSDYVCFKEIGMAIEALGGNFNDDRDFSKDKNYIKIKEANKNEHKDKN